MAIKPGRTGVFGAARDLHTRLDGLSITVPKPVEDPRRQWLAIRASEPVVDLSTEAAMRDAVVRWIKAAPTKPDVAIRHPVDLREVIAAEVADANAERAHHAWTLAAEWSAQWFVRAVNDHADDLIDACADRAAVVILKFHAAARAIPAGFAGSEQLAYAAEEIRADYVKAAGLWTEWVAMVRLVADLDTPKIPADGWNQLLTWLVYVRTDYVYEHREVQTEQGSASLEFGLNLARRLDVESFWFSRGMNERHTLADQLWPPRGMYQTGPLSPSTWIAG